MQNQEKVLETHKPNGTMKIKHPKPKKLDRYEVIQVGDKKVTLYDDYLFVHADPSNKLVIQFSKYSRVIIWTNWGNAEKDRALLRLEQNKKSGQWRITEMNYKDEL